MDFAEEQRNEVEALESIYLDDIEVIESDPWSFTIYVESDCQDDNPKYEACSAQFRFTLTSCYPDTPPEMQITALDNLSDKDTTIIMELMKEQADENSGMAMIFALLSAAKDKMNDIAESNLMQKDDEIQKLTRLAEERDKAVRSGTPVTVSNFLSWKAEFDREQSLSKKRSKMGDGSSTKLTGRQLFENDSSLKNSDASFIQDGDVRIDESLFEDLDDLDIEDD